LPATGFSQTAAQTNAVAFETGLAAIETKVEARRKELGIPGMSLAIVKDGKVIYAKGLGYKDFENSVPATADTQFAIGSSTKAFTALSVLMTADEGKLSIDASPKTVLPYFKMADPETDKNMTIRDLMTHSSGLNRTDLAMITGKLTRQELIRVAGEAKPIGKLHEKFGYQNLMFTTAGEVVAVAQKQPWEKFVPTRVFKPLGMTNSNMSIAEMEKAKDKSFGYTYNFDTKETRKLPYRPIDDVAPAGSINSSANDMAKWLQFVLAGGVAPDGKRLVSEKGYQEWLKPQMKVDPAGTVNYALGWFVQKWKDKTVVQHGGNIDGFNAMVAMIPEEKLGFVMLTNVSASSLGGELLDVVFSNILAKPSAPETVVGGDVAAEKEAGKYRLEAANLDFEIKWADGKLTTTVPGQPVYTLEKVSSRRYKLDGAPAGFFITFKDKELLLEQPQGNYTLPKVGGDTPKPSSPVVAKELLGKWASVSSGRIVEIKEMDGTVTLNIEGQQPYTLTDRAKDEFKMSPLPESFWIKVKRGTDGKVVGFTSMQPQGNVEFVPAETKKISITVDELYAKALAASGGEANWRKITSRITTADVDLEQQGVKGKSTSWSKAPNKNATETEMFAIGKKIAVGWEYFDGIDGEEAYSFAPAEKYTGKRLEDVRLGSDIYSMLDWRAKYKSVEIERMAKCGEDEECYVVAFVPEKGSKFYEFYSTKTFLQKRREGTISSSTSSVQIPYSIKFEDYREVDGVMLPFKQINNTASNGDIVTIVTSIKHNVPIDDSMFKAKDVKF
jgi:CubicO group peptidase (beta-lactamase class C family)